MAEYQAIDPNVETRGGGVLAFISGMGDSAIPILKKHGLHPVDADGWYNQQKVLDAYRELRNQDFMNLVAIGMKVPDTAVWPPEVDTVHNALASLDVAYQMNHRGGEIGGYHYQETGPNSGTIVANNPFPSDFDYGLIYRVVQKFRKETVNHLLVILDETQPSRKNGDDSCTYLISW